MDKRELHHALKILPEVCIGCSNCMRVCPTHALRISNGKAILYPNRCIDCGECYRVCPVNAIIVEQDDFNIIFEYKRRVALIPAVLLGQFTEDVTTDDIHTALIQLGFTDVFEVENSADFVGEYINKYLADPDKPKPAISSFCPAIVRLIQVKYPALVDNIMLLKPPLDLSAMYYKKMLMEQGVGEQDIGIFYVTPCAAKIAAVKSPVGEDKSEISGVINMDFIYNKVLKVYKNRDKEYEALNRETACNPKNLMWSLTNGEANFVKAKCLAIDSLDNAMEFLDKVENQEIGDVDFLEIRACDESCAGGVLTTGNRFLTVQRLKSFFNDEKVNYDDDKANISICDKYRDYLVGRISVEPIAPRGIDKLDDDMTKAMKKMERINRIMCYLPGIDCGSCGAPTCQTLAEDIVHGRAAISHCIFLQKTMEQIPMLNPSHSFRIMEKIWGKERFQKDCSKAKTYRIRR